MAKRYVPSFPMSVPMTIMIPEDVRVQGVPKKVLKEGDLFFGSYRTYQTNDRTNNDVKTPERVVVVDTWYRPDIKSNNKIRMEPGGEIYDIVGDPEDIEMRHQFLQIRLQRAGGKA